MMNLFILYYARCGALNCNKIRRSKTANDPVTPAKGCMQQRVLLKLRPLWIGEIYDAHAHKHAPRHKSAFASMRVVLSQDATIRQINSPYEDIRHHEYICTEIYDIRL